MNISFLDLFNASISASWLVLVVIVLRLALKKAPRSIHCLLWALVAFRLLCPISIESPVSLMPSTETLSMDYRVEQSIYTSQQTVLDIVENPIYPENVNVTIDSPISSPTVWDIEWSLIWLIGVSVMAVYVLVSWLRLRRQVAASIPIAKDIRLCDHIESPFILGVFRPVIYLPSDLGQDALDHVLAHEMAHIARKDHWWKPLGFALLTVHWFNPIMWLAYILLCRDIELACDEKVIRNLDIQQKKAYSAALLGCSVSRPLIAACPLAFGEVGVKERVKTVLNYKKPAFWIVVVAVILCIAVAACFLTDPLSLKVDDIILGEDHTVLALCDQYIDLQISVEDLPTDLEPGRTRNYGKKEAVVYQDDTTTIRLRHVRYVDESNSQMYFEFDVSYDLPKVGSIILPYHITQIGDDDFERTFFRIAENPGGVDNYAYDDGAFSVCGIDADDKFSIYVDTAVVNQPHLHFMTIGVCMDQMTYAEIGQEPELNRGVYSSVVAQDKSFQASGNEIYRIGWDSMQREVFLDPYGAFQQFCADYAAAICHIRDYNALNPLTPLNYYEYLRLGWQTVPADEALAAQCAAVSDFLDIYDNSMIPANEYENAHNGTYKAGDLLAQHAIFSSGFGTGNMIFHLNEHKLSVYDLGGNELLSSTRIVISNPTRDELFAAMENCMAVWKTGENGQVISEMRQDFIPDAEHIELWEFHADNSQTHYAEYTLFFFDGELKWFAENYNDSYKQIYEVTTPMPEDTLLPDGSYVGQEKNFWAWHSSFFAYKMEMEVTSNELTIRFNDGKWSVGPLPLDRNWQAECPIGEKRREILADLSDLDPDLAMQDLSDCRFMVVNDSHFIVEKNEKMYLVSWNRSDKALEIINYIFHFVPHTEYEDPSVTIDLGSVTMEADPVEAAILRQIRFNNPIEVNGVMTSSISFEPVQHIIGCGRDGSDNIIYLKARIGVYANDPQFRQVYALDFDAAIHIFTSSNAEPEVLAYWQSNTGTPEELKEKFGDFPQDFETPEISPMELELECVRQAALHFGLDGDVLTEQLKQEHPDYFNLAPTDKLEVMWRDTPDGIRCGITDGINYNLTNDLTSLEAYLILRQYPDAEAAFLEVKAGGASEPANYGNVFSNP